MPIEITVPRLGWSMEEGNFADWLKAPGEQVQSGDPLFSLESDKVTMEVESLDSGVLYLRADAPQSGAVVKPGQLIGYLLAVGEAPPDALALEATEVSVTPRARRVAAELGVNPAELQGSGAGGRVRERDVRAVTEKPAIEHTIPINSTRRATAARMMESHLQTAPVTLTRRVDASRLVALRNRWKLARQPAAAPSFNDIVTKLVGTALQRHPMLGAQWDGDQLQLPSEIHIGLAVDTDNGLLVPVIHNVPDLAIEDLARCSRDLIAAARERSIRAKDLLGAVFTISSLGSFGVEAFTPIINFPQAAVLGIGAIRWEAVVLASGQIVAREQMTLSLSFDHRVVDGAPAALFLATIAELIEEPPASVHMA